MRVLHVDPAAEWRGGQAQMVHLLRARPGDQWAGDPAGEVARRFRPPDVVLHPGNDPRNALSVRLACARLGVDLAAAQTSHGHNACLAAGVPLVVHRRNHRPPGNAWKYRAAASTIADSAFVARLCVEAGISRVDTVYDGVDAPRVGDGSGLPPRPSGTLLVAVGALVPHKGHAHLARAMQELPGMELWIAGEGPLRSELAALGGRVRLLGQVNDIGALLGLADVFVHPSVEEALGGAVIEAMASGCRVVATRTGGTPEIVGDCGELVAAGDPGALAEGVRRALTRPKGEGIARAARFSVAEMVRKTTEIYERVAAQG